MDLVLKSLLDPRRSPVQLQDPCLNLYNHHMIAASKCHNLIKVIIADNGFTCKISSSCCLAFKRFCSSSLFIRIIRLDRRKVEVNCLIYFLKSFDLFEMLCVRVCRSIFVPYNPRKCFHLIKINLYFQK